jgi:DNA helicase II / ATP-dependent DNA helicase PcrA
MIKKVLGPPGTGKTRRLLDEVDNYLKKGVPLNKIGYFAFTRKAANEARERFLKINKNFNKTDVKFFQTLHSLAFHTLGMSEDNVMQPVHYEQIGKELSIRVNYSSDSEESCYMNCDNEYFKLIGKARVKCISIEDEFNTNEWSRDIDLDTLHHINFNLNNYKKAYNLDDYTDMIEKFVRNSDRCPLFEVIFIDEAQDLSPIQWKMFDVLKSKSKDVFLAGDDDQAIFAWAGADVNRFIDEPADEEVLQQSERIPLAVQELSNTILNRIQGKRKEKIYHAKKDKDGNVVQGNVDTIFDIDNLDLTKDKWLILTRTTYRSDEISELLKEKRLYFKNRYGKSIDHKLYKSVLKWTELTSGKEISVADCKDIYEYLEDNFNEKKFENKSSIKIEDIGFTPGVTWFDVFTNLDQEKELYIRTLLSNGEKLSEEPRIEVSTIHAAKGGECRNVILVLDNARKIRQSMETSIDKQDEEHRVWYVGVTRSMENLYILKSKKDWKGYQL